MGCEMTGPAALFIAIIAWALFLPFVTLGFAAVLSSQVLEVLRRVVGWK